MEKEKEVTEQNAETSREENATINSSNEKKEVSQPVTEKIWEGPDGL